MPDRFHSRFRKSSAPIHIGSGFTNARSRITLCVKNVHGIAVQQYIAVHIAPALALRKFFPATRKVMLLLFNISLFCSLVSKKTKQKSVFSLQFFKPATANNFSCPFTLYNGDLSHFGNPNFQKSWKSYQLPLLSLTLYRAVKKLILVTLNL